MSNRPCLDKALMEKLVKEVCNENGYDASKFSEAIEKSFIGWFSRSVAAAIFVFCKDRDGKRYVLASERGPEAADFRGKWNCVSGYLDYNERVSECAVRELLEEVGVKLNAEDIEFVGFNDAITENRQNVTIRYRADIKDKTIDEITFSKDGNEGKEVGEIKFIPIDEIDNYEWAFNHNEIIKEILDIH